MDKLKIVTVVGTRPEVIRLSCVIKKLDQHCSHFLVHTGQNYDYELNEIFFEQFNIRRPDFFLDAARSTPAVTIGNVIIEIDKVFEQLKPDALLILGDTDSCLSAIPAKRRKIPIFHMEAGNRCFDMRVPEEINRRIVDHIADVNLTYSNIAREHLLAEGLNTDRIIRIGSPMREVLEVQEQKILNSGILKKLNLNKACYFLFSFHRQENVDVRCNLQSIVNVLNQVEKIYGQKIIVSTHPRTRSKLKEFGINASENILFHKPFGYHDYIKLQMEARLVISDSGSITEEAAILGFPALNIRETHERPEGMEETVAMMTGLDEHSILRCIEVALSQSNSIKEKGFAVKDYEPNDVSDKVLKIIHSYTGYVNRVVWKR